MNRARLAILFIAVLAILGAVSFSGLMGGKPKKQAEVKLKVLVAARNLSLGDVLGEQGVKWAEWPKENAMPGMITSKDGEQAAKNVYSSRARQAIYEGEPVLKAKLVDSSDPGILSAMLNKGYRAVTVSLSPESGVGGFVLPNDRVDVLVITKNGNKPVARTVITDVRVLAIDQNIGTPAKPAGDKEAAAAPKPASGKGGQRTATLELNPRQALSLAEAAGTSKITLALRSLAEASGDSSPREFDDDTTPAPRSIGLLRYGIKSVIQVTP